MIGEGNAGKGRVLDDKKRIMKTITSPVVLIAAILFVGCRTELPSQHRTEAQADVVQPVQSPPASVPQHLTDVQAIALAAPLLPLPPGDSYRARFIEDASKVYAPGNVRASGGAIWWVYTDRDGAEYRSWMTVVIRDSDGKVLGIEAHL
jgi:hypothetical protein